MDAEPKGFVAHLGVLAPIGIRIRNSVILVSRTEQLRQEDNDGWTSMIEATEHRMHPIMLTTASEPGMDSDRARGVRGTDSLGHDRRHHRRHRADASVPAGGATNRTLVVIGLYASILSRKMYSLAGKRYRPLPCSSETVHLLA